jgi:hypothetical protein
MSSVQEILKGHATPKTVAANYSAAQTDKAVWTPAKGKRIVLMGVLFSTDTAMDIKLEKGDTLVIPSVYLAANSEAVIPAGDFPVWVGGKGEALSVTSSKTGNHSVLLFGYEL